MKKIKITEAQAKLLGLIKTPKNTLKITQEQYNRIFGSKIVSESFPKVDPIRVDKQIKKQFHEDEAIQASPMKLTDFKKPLQGIPNSKSFNKPVMEDVEVHDQSSVEFVKFLYGKGELSEEWTEGMVREAIAKLSKSGLIVPTEDGNFKVSTSMGDPKAAMQSIKQELETIKPQGEEMGMEALPMDSEQGIEEVDTDHPSSPDFIPANEKSGTISKLPTVYKVIYINREMALLEKDGNLYYFNYRDSNFEDNIEDYIGSWETDIDSGKNDLSIEDMQNFINDYWADLSVGLGEEGLNDGKDLIALDDESKQYISSVYKLDKNLHNILNQTNESDDFKAGIKKAFSEPSKGAGTKSREELRAAELARREKEKQDLQSRYDSAEEIDEMTALGGGGGVFQASGHNNFPVGKLGKPIEKEIQAVNEGPTAGPASTGPYDANALGGIGRNGEFKKVGKTKAETTPQWAGGSFVEQPECSKLNNNKEAQNGGCNTGASSLKLKKASGSVNAPSLAENKIYAAIAAKTGKSIQEIKTIIESKKGKP